MNVPHQSRGHGRKMGKGKWVQWSSKAIANTGVSPLRRGFVLFGVSGMSLLSPAPQPYWPWEAIARGCEALCFGEQQGSLQMLFG